MDFAPQWPAEGESGAAEAKIAMLHAELAQIERRLGTAAERAEDLQAAQDTAHAISNLRMRAAMQRELARHKAAAAKRRAPLQG